MPGGTTIATITRSSQARAVLDELVRGDFEGKTAALLLMQGVRIVPVEPSVEDIVEAYIKRGVMPRDPAGDALHLTLASYHKCDFLLTWNCIHLANANKFPHIRRVNAMLELYMPLLVTPLELLGGTEDDVYEG